MSVLQPSHQTEVFGDLAQSGNWVGFEGGELEQPVLIRLDRADDGRLICTGLVIGAHWGSSRRSRTNVELTSRSLRGVRVAELVSQVQAGLKRGEWDAIARMIYGTIGDLAEPVKGLRRTRPGPQGHPRTHFQAVAATYRQVIAEGHRAPFRELTARLHVSEATARRWVQRARDMGLLGPSQPGKAGEAPRRKRGKR